jgi:single-stranded DNA-binding protein
VVGTLFKERWTDKQSGQPRESDAIVADDITLDLQRVEEITLRRAKEREEPAATEGGEAPPPDSHDSGSTSRSGSRRRSGTGRAAVQR